MPTLTLAQWSTKIQSTFNKRNAIVRRVTAICGHLFENTFLKEPTKCSQCNLLIWVSGEQCQLCRLVAHRKCLQGIETACRVATADKDNEAPSQDHCQTKSFTSPTMCDHCGTFLKGLFSQGVECSSCSRCFHFDCKKNHFVPSACQPRREARQNNINIKPPYRHRSWINIEDFEIIRLLGSGSFSKVYLAKFRDEEFAIKAIKKTNVVVSNDPESLFTEWKVLNMGRTYPFLTIGHGCFQSRDRLYFVMEYVRGQDLVYHIRKERKFTEYRAKFHSAEIVLALSYLHSQGVVYRDLKLDNIILDKTGHCKLLDFGMSKVLSPEKMRTRTFCGTSSYISPEILRGDDYDHSTDWWSLGVLLYEMLTGFTPFEAETEEETYDAIQHKELDFPYSLSDRARSILEGLLTKEPQRRLGCQLMEGCSRAIREHPFFLFSVNGRESHQWNELECKLIKPPYRPSLDDLEIRCDCGTNKLTPIGSKELKYIDQSDFEKFSFYSESFEELNSSRS